MNPYGFPPCYYPPGTYFFTPYPQQQPVPLPSQDQDQKKLIQKLQSENADLKQKLAELQAVQLTTERKDMESSSLREPSEGTSKRQCRRRKKTLDKTLTCPYEGCCRFYGTMLALNLHIKLKHNGGTKKQRETYAKILLNCEKNGEKPPQFNCNFPPGFIEEQRGLHKHSNLRKNN